MDKQAKCALLRAVGGSIYVYIHVLSLSFSVCMYIHIHVFIYIYICLHVCIHTFVCVCSTLSAEGMEAWSLRDLRLNVEHSWYPAP